MDADALKGLAVVSRSEGTRLGRVEDVLIGPQGWQVAALLVGGTGHGQPVVIPFAKIAHIGVDAVMVESSQVTQPVSTGDAFSSLPGLDALKKLKVVDAAGTLVGTVRGLDIDAVTGRVLSLAVHKGGLLGRGGTTTTVSAEAVQRVGPDIITLASGDASPAPPQ